MPVVAFHGRDPNSEARALLHGVLSDGDILGSDDRGRTALLLMVDPWTLDRLLAFDADAADDEAEPDQEIDGPATILELAQPTRIRRASRLAQAVALAVLLVTGPQIEVRADQAAVAAPLPMSTAQTSQECCRVCRKGQPCGDGCISAEKQCKRDHGCACSAAGKQEDGG